MKTQKIPPPKRRKNFIHRRPTGRKMAPFPPLKMSRNKPDEKIQDEVKKNPSVWASIGEKINWKKVIPGILGGATFLGWLYFDHVRRRRRGREFLEYLRTPGSGYLSSL